MTPGSRRHRAVHRARALTRLNSRAVAGDCPAGGHRGTGRAGVNTSPSPGRRGCVVAILARHGIGRAARDAVPRPRLCPHRAAAGGPHSTRRVVADDPRRNHAVAAANDPHPNHAAADDGPHSNHAAARVLPVSALGRPERPARQDHWAHRGPPDHWDRQVLPHRIRAAGASGRRGTARARSGRPEDSYRPRDEVAVPRPVPLGHRGFGVEPTAAGADPDRPDAAAAVRTPDSADSADSAGSAARCPDRDVAALLANS